MTAEEAADLAATRRTVAALLPTIDGLEAEGYLSDLSDALRSVQGIVRVDARKTADPMCRFEASCRFTGKASAVARRVETAWTKRLAYRLDAVHRVEMAGADGFTLEFVTWLPARWHITGRVIARTAVSGSAAGEGRAARPARRTRRTARGPLADRQASGPGRP